MFWQCFDYLLPSWCFSAHVGSPPEVTGVFGVCESVCLWFTWHLVSVKPMVSEVTNCDALSNSTDHPRAWTDFISSLQEKSNVISLDILDLVLYPIWRLFSGNIWHFLHTWQVFEIWHPSVENKLWELRGQNDVFQVLMTLDFELIPVKNIEIRGNDKYIISERLKAQYLCNCSSIVSLQYLSIPHC